VNLSREILPQLNSLTKYPKIPTFHIRGERELTEMIRPISTSFGPVHIKEKYNGASSRIIVWPGEAILIGSHGELLACWGDFLYDAELAIAETLLPLVERIANPIMHAIPDNLITVLFGEVYGSKATDAWRNYGTGEARFRLFDVAAFSPSRLAEPIESISAWRENAGEQAWYKERDLQDFAAILNIPLAKLLDTVDPHAIPTSIQGMYDFLSKYKQTTDGPKGGLSEGVVMTDFMRRYRLKARLPEYAKIINRQAEEIRLSEKQNRRDVAAARMQNR
jgi:hypothetical protein